jgi:hypothetical protein
MTQTPFLNPYGEPIELVDTPPDRQRGPGMVSRWLPTVRFLAEVVPGQWAKIGKAGPKSTTTAVAEVAKRAYPDCKWEVTIRARHVYARCVK